MVHLDWFILNKTENFMLQLGFIMVFKWLKTVVQPIGKQQIHV